ncbi:TraM recognition domain-containing protein [Nonomuraea dietziae]|uniref:TraM recognition domain-containing protein n=1 Tax=Nonomuraea dietziae TaxID=65515 RepID=UPI003CD0A8E7
MRPPTSPPIEDLPDLYSFLGSLGIPIVTILQSYQQGARVWGQAGMDALWGAATVKVLGAGPGRQRLRREDQPLDRRTPHHRNLGLAQPAGPLSQPLLPQGAHLLRGRRARSA